VVHPVDVERAAAHAAPLPPTTRPRAATPRARRLAAERGIDLATVATRHADGAIHADDLDTAQPATPGTAAPSTAPPPKPAAPGDSAAKLQRAVGRLMERSKREIPHYYLSHEIDCQRALAWLEARNADRPVTERVLPAALLLRATVLALTAVPECNGHYVDGEFVPATHVHLGVAVSTRGGGLLSPVIAHAETLALDELMAAMRDIVNRTRGGTLRSSDTDQATVTVTNLGDQGTDRVFGVIVPPQVAIIGFGRITERPWARDGMLAVHRTVTASLSADHRVSHGHRGAKLLTTMAAVLDEPEARL
jgi:pyruvate dehydrogenase E2 component (dihydrolipoamide acetyltransferase)